MKIGTMNEKFGTRNEITGTLKDKIGTKKIIYMWNSKYLNQSLYYFVVEVTLVFLMILVHSEKFKKNKLSVEINDNISNKYTLILHDSLTHNRNK